MLLTTSFRWGVRPTQPPVQWVQGVLSPGVKHGRGVTLTTHSHLVPRSWMSRSYTSSPQAPPWRVTGLLYFTLNAIRKIWPWVCRSWKCYFPHILHATAEFAKLKAMSKHTAVDLYHNLHDKFKEEENWLYENRRTQKRMSCCYCYNCKLRMPKIFWSLGFVCEQGSSVSIVSGYGLDDWAIEVRSPAKAKVFLL
jgi:hypothetical protein